jgi:hypothetical protein
MEIIMATPTEYIKLTGTRLRETEKAVHFRVDQVGEAVLEESVTHWFPLSQIQKSTTLPTEGEDELFVADWICRAKELV